jgi:hypothetical protein
MPLLENIIFYLDACRNIFLLFLLPYFSEKILCEVLYAAGLLGS